MADEKQPRAELAVHVDAGALPAPIRDALTPEAEPPPVPAQRSSHANASKLESEKIVISAPLSYAGSAARIWKLTGVATNPWLRVGVGAASVILILGAWCFVTAWYVFFGLLLVPYRIVRRGSRKRKREALKHREMLAAIQSHSSDR